MKPNDRKHPNIVEDDHERAQGQVADAADQDENTEKRTDTLASEATTDSPEARQNEAGLIENISEEGASGDPEEVDQIAGPPMESVSRDKEK